MTAPRPVPHPEIVDGLRAGIERLLEDGLRYAEIPIDTLVAEGGVAKSTFYVYFTDKDELLRVIAADVIQDLVGFDRAWWTLPADATKQQTHDALVAMFDAYNAHGALMGAIVEAAIYDPIMKTQFDTLMTGAISATADHLRAFSPDIDAERVAFWLTWTLERGFNMLLPAATGAVRTRRLAAMTEVIWRTARSRD